MGISRVRSATARRSSIVVSALLLSLLVEELGEAREGLILVVRADRDVLMGRGELPSGLFVACGRKTL
jgi:hypothetical protein